MWLGRRQLILGTFCSSPFPLLPNLPKILTAHFASACVVSNDKTDGAQLQHEDWKSGHNMFQIPTQLPPVSVFIKSAENSGLPIVIYEGGFPQPLFLLSGCELFLQ